jgi:hypothetical protein
MFDEHAKFLERACIGEKLDPLPRGEFSAPVLGTGPCLATAVKGMRATRRKPFESLFHLSCSNSLRNWSAH